MKIYPEQLSQHLAKQLAPIYFVSGDEILLVQETCDQIRAAAKKSGITQRENFEVTTGLAWDKFLLATKNISLFSEKKLLELRFSSIKQDAKSSKILESYIANPMPDDVLLIIAPKLDPGWQKIKWLKMLEEKGIFIQVWPIEENYLPGWIDRRLKQYGLIANQETCKLLAEKFTGNLLAAKQEIEKLALLYGPGKLDSEQVLNATSSNAHYNVFALVDYALKGDKKKIIVSLDNLKSDGVEPILILWALTRELRIMINILLAKNKGIPLDQAIAEQKVFAKHIPLIKSALARHSLETLTKLLRKTAKIDRMIKGVEKGEVWTELAIICDSYV